MAVLSKTGITQNNTIQAWHVSQSIDALTGGVEYDITISGSLTLTGSVDSLNGYTGSLKGTADTGSKANNIIVNNNATTNQLYRLTYVLDSNTPGIGTSTYLPLYADSGSDGSGLSYNPSTNALTASAFVGTASWAENVITVPTPVAIKATANPSGSASIPNSLFRFIAGADQTGNAPNTVALTIGELTGKTLGQDCFVTATCSGSAGVGATIVVNSLIGNILTLESSAPNTDFFYTVMYY